MLLEPRCIAMPNRIPQLYSPVHGVDLIHPYLPPLPHAHDELRPRRQPYLLPSPESAILVGKSADAVLGQGRVGKGPEQRGVLV
jgi:hypothetical protein